MIAHLSGTVIDIRDRSIVINVSGIGYEALVPAHVIGQAVAHESITIWTHMVVRETSIELFGFADNNERLLFTRLIGISGVGPRSALSVLDSAPLDHLVTAIRGNDSSVLTRVSGIGKKTAEKIVLELSDKLDHLASPSDNKTFSTDTTVMDALQALGYSMTEARNALKDISDEYVSTNDRIKAALKILGN